MKDTRESPANYIVGAFIVIVGLAISAKVNYLLFHSLAELFSIIIAVSLFLIMWNSKKYMENKTLVFISIAYLFIAIIDVLHTLSYKGMSIFKDYDFYANQLWVAARYMEGLTLLIAFARPDKVNQIIRRVGTQGIWTLYFLTTVMLVVSIFVWRIFPICFIANQGQTQFKIISEYIICLLLMAGILFLWKNRKDFDNKIYKLLIGSMTLTILQELSFALYTDNFGILNMMGHYFKIFSFYLMYRAIVKTGIVEPYNLIFRELTINEAKLKEAKNLAEVANSLKSSFLANMSHEIRTPLNSMLGFANILFEEEKDLVKLEKLRIIRNSGDHLLSLINNILDFSKIEAGKMEIEKSSFSILKLLDNLKNMFIIKSQERHLSWEVYIDPSVPENIVGDEHRIMQVLINLSGNAFKFTESGGVDVHASYRDGQLEIRVKDTGIGIPKEKRQTIFSAFEQVDASHMRKYGGTGLGLSITRNLLDLMGGRIQIESTGSGTEFVMSLPAEIVTREIPDHVESAGMATFEPDRNDRIIFFVADGNKPIDMEATLNRLRAGAFEGCSVKAISFNSKTKDRILVAGADLVLLYENIGDIKLKVLARDLKQDFRTSFLPIILIKECRGDQIRFHVDSNALKFGKVSRNDGFYEFINQVIQGREAVGAAMMEKWLEKAENEIGTNQILLNCLNDIAIKVDSLEVALFDQAMESIKYLTHSLKGGTGNLRMTEVYLRLSDMEAEVRREPFDLENLRKVFSVVKELMALIPKEYFDMERLQSEKLTHLVSKLQVLIVDDNLENRKLIGYILDRLNLKHKDAENGEVALAMLRAERFDMILLDSQMPIMDGMTTLNRIRKDSALKDLYVIMQTASAFKEDIQDFFQAGCDDYISKPVDLGVLQKKLAEFIAR